MTGRIDSPLPPAVLARQFTDSLTDLIARAGNPPTLVAAFSGGLDSTVLLHLLAARPPSGTRIVAAHLNHSLRGPDSAADQAFCRSVAEGLAVPFATRTVDAAAVARSTGTGLEEAGRRLRYSFFRDVGGPDGLVLTAHHADDQAETILMNLRRGAHRRGLAGMRPLTRLPLPDGGEVALARPLLGVGRETIRAYALANGIVWREDASNADIRFLRNRIRRRVLPGLDRLLPGFRARLLVRAAVAAKEEDRLAAAGRELSRLLSRREGGGLFLRLDAGALEETDTERLAYALRYVVENETARRLPGGSPLAGLLALARAGAPGEALTLPGGLLVRRERDGLFFSFPGPGPLSGAKVEAEAEEFLLPPPPFAVRAGGLCISADWQPCPGPSQIPAPDARDPGVQWLDPAAVVWPLRLRPPYPGEKFRPLGSPGRRKIQDILVDGHVARHLRAAPHVIADAAGALWVYPLRLSNRARINAPLERALRITVRADGAEPAEAEEN